VAETNVEKARRCLEAALRGDLGPIAELLDDDVKWHGGDPSAVGACHNRTEALRFMRQSDVIRNARFEVVDVIGAGDTVVLVMRPLATSGTDATAVANLTTFHDGKITEIVHYPNVDDALAAAGQIHG
jgi:ketosteroid isomerase-like protein